MTDRNQWSTPDDLFSSLHARYDFTVDACAVAWNAKLPRYWTPEHDGLAQDWSQERVWCNPPYGRGLILPWVEKALYTVYANHSRDPYNPEFYTILLLPSRTDTNWFQMLREKDKNHGARIYFLDKRVRFVPPPGIKASSPTEASILVKVWA